ncbi:MAG: peptidylprolyl isomerase [Acidimicrobiia bacterium]
MHRRSFALAGALALGLIATSCDITSPTAAKVNGVEISDSDLQDHLQGWRSAWAAGREQQPNAFAPLVEKLPGASLPSELATYVLQIEILGALVHGGLAERGITPSADDLQAARVKWASQMGGEEIFAKFPKDYADQLVTNLAEQNALGRFLAEDLVKQDPSQRRLCLSHILVGTEADANAVEARLAKGEDFATIASEVSSDAGSAANGGALRDQNGSCDSLASLSGYVPEFADAASTAKLGVPTAPVKSEFGYHVILLTDTPPPSPREGLEPWLAEVIPTAKITVNPKYGSWDPNQGVVAPVAPVVAADATPETLPTIGQ